MPSTDVIYYFPTLLISCTYFALGRCQDLNISKIIKQNHKLSEENEILIKKSLSVKAVWWTKVAERIAWQGLETWKHRQSAEENRKTSCPVRLPGSGRPHSSRGSGGPCAQSGGQAKKAPISLCDFAWNCHYPFKCAQDNSPRSPAETLQMTSCSAVVWSKSHLPFHSLINNFIVCEKSSYYSIINRNFNNKSVE